MPIQGRLQLMPILPPLPRPQRRRIHKIIHATRDKGHARRLMAILLLHEGRTITDVHHLTGAARSTIGRWLRWYRDEGVGALEALPAGRAPILHIPVENEPRIQLRSATPAKSGNLS